MEYFKKNPLITIIGIALVVAVLFSVVIMLSNRGKSPEINPTDKVTIVDPKTGESLTFYRDGLVIRQTKDGTVSEVWDKEKIESFFTYINTNISTSANNEGSYQVAIEGSNESKSGAIASNDELVNLVINSNTGSGSTPGQGGGSDVTQFFPSPTPTPYTGGSIQTPSPTLPPSAPSWCKHWKLSYCADVIIVTTPVPSSTADPNVIKAENCDEWSTQDDRKTVISNNLCPPKE